MEKEKTDNNQQHENEAFCNSVDPTTSRGDVWQYKPAYGIDATQDFAKEAANLDSAFTWNNFKKSSFRTRKGLTNESLPNFLTFKSSSLHFLYILIVW